RGLGRPRRGRHHHAPDAPAHRPGDPRAAPGRQAHRARARGVRERRLRLPLLSPREERPLGSDRIPGTTGMRTGVASRPRGVLGADGGLMASNRPPDDVLGGLPVERVAAWYRRLAAYSDAKAAEA